MANYPPVAIHSPTLYERIGGHDGLGQRLRTLAAIHPPNMPQ